MKTLFFLVLLTSFASQVFAEDRSSGCGVGWMVTKSMSTSGSFTRSLTNATFSSQFAMTSGTSGCARHDLVMVEKQKIHYVENNFHPLKREIAFGDGERVLALSQVWGCRNSSFVGRVLKSNFEEIFMINSPSAVVNKVNEVLLREPNLIHECIGETQV
jgi:hypothetical protein